MTNYVLCSTFYKTDFDRMIGLLSEGCALSGGSKANVAFGGDLQLGDLGSSIVPRPLSNQPGGSSAGVSVLTREKIIHVQKQRYVFWASKEA